VERVSLSTVFAFKAGYTLVFLTNTWNDNHQFDASSHKGSIDMNGDVQQNVSAGIHSNATRSGTALGRGELRR